MLFSTALADEVCEGHLFLLWQGDTGLVGCFSALQEIGHVAGKKTHVLHALKVVHHVLGIEAVHTVPVAGADDGHLAQGKVLVQLIDGRRGACAPGTDHDSSGLQRKAAAIAVEIGEEGPVHEALDLAGRRTPVDGRAEDEAVVVGCDVEEFVHSVLEDALILFCALAAAKTACQRLDADPEHVCGNAFLFQCP